MGISVTNSVDAQADRGLDFKAPLERAPGLYLLLLSTDLTAAAASYAYCHPIMQVQKGTPGRSVFETLPDSVADPKAAGVANLCTSIERVLWLFQPDAMPSEKCDIHRPVSEADWFELLTKRFRLPALAARL
jgi:hypothetical protein